MLRRQPRNSTTPVEREVLPHIDALYGYALFLTRNRTESEELTQETLLKAVGSFHQYREGTNCKAWLFRIMHNTFLNSLRRRRSVREMDDAGVAELGEREDMQAFIRANPGPEESFVSHLTRGKVREAIERLPPEFRSAVVLADLEELSYKEIAEIVGAPIGTVMSRLHRGRRLLRIRLLQWARELGLVAEEEASVGAGTEEVSGGAEDNVTPLAAYRGRVPPGAPGAPDVS